MVKSYYDKLKDPRWQRVRLQVMERAQFSCEECGAKDKTLHVHHRRYRKGADPWDYPLDQLACICETCHSDNHERNDLLSEILAALDTESIENILGYAHAKFAVRNWRQLDKKPIVVRGYKHAEGLLDGLWNWNTGEGKPDPCCLIDHGRVNDALACYLGEGEMPTPGEKGT